MSTILRALRRLDEENASQERVGLHDRVVAAPRRPARKLARTWKVVAAAGVAACLGAVVSWQVSPELRSPRLSTAAIATRATAPIPPVAAPPPPRSEQRAAPVADPVTPVDAPPEREITQASSQAVTAPPPEISSEVSVHDRGPIPSLLEPEVAEPEPVLAAIPREPELPQAAPESPPPAITPLVAQPQPSVAVPEPAPAINDPKIAEIIAAAIRSKNAEPPEPPPTKARTQVASNPDVIVTQTVWHPDPARRSAIVDVQGSDGPQTVSEGDRVAGLLLLKIKPSGIVFERDGEEITQRVGKRK